MSESYATELEQLLEEAWKIINEDDTNSTGPTKVAQAITNKYYDSFSEELKIYLFTHGFADKIMKYSQTMNGKALREAAIKTNIKVECNIDKYTFAHNEMSKLKMCTTIHKDDNEVMNCVNNHLRGNRFSISSLANKDLEQMIRNAHFINEKNKQAQNAKFMSMGDLLVKNNREFILNEIKNEFPHKWDTENGRKHIFDFSVEDFEYTKQQCSRQITAYSNKENFCVQSQELLVQSNKNTIKDLPIEHLKQFHKLSLTILDPDTRGKTAMKSAT